MCNVPSLGALIKGSKEYVYPGIAKKTEKYECPDCHKDLIFRKGDVRIHHFAHRKSDNPCTYYSGPSESQIHKDAKMLLKNLLERKTKIIIKKKCCGEFEIPMMTDKSKIVLEHRFEYNGLKIADVAYLDDNKISYIFEICHTHKTDDDKRPDPWFEIDAYKLLKEANDNRTVTLKISCIRKNKCKKCKFLTRKVELEKLKPLRRIYVDIPYKDSEYARSLKLWFDNKKQKKWMMWSSNQNKDLILSKYKEWKCDEEDDDILIKKINRNFIMELLKPQNGKILDMFVRSELGQTSFHPEQHICKTDNGEVISVYDRPYHDRLSFHTEYNNEIQYNKITMETFQKYFGDLRCVLHAAKGCISAYVVTQDDYDTYNYWNERYYHKMELPYFNCYEYSGDGTVDIIKDLLKKICVYNGTSNKYNNPKKNIKVNNFAKKIRVNRTIKTTKATKATKNTKIISQTRKPTYVCVNSSESNDPSECKESEENNNASDSDEHEEHEESEECEESEDSFDPFKSIN